MPSVVTTQPMLPPSLAIGRIAMASVRPPTRPTSTMPASSAAYRPMPWPANSTAATAASIITEPCPKFRVRVVRKVRFSPSAISA